MIQPSLERQLKDLERLTLALIDALTNDAAFSFDKLFIPITVEDKLKSAIMSGKLNGRISR
jgi:hypothetical protein